MSFASLFNGGARRGATPPRRTDRPSEPQPSAPQTKEGRIGQRLNRYTAQANGGLDSAFVPEELGDMFANSRQMPFEQIERNRPL